MGFTQVIITPMSVERFNPDLAGDNLSGPLLQDSINFHPSLLPKHRGSLTQFWAIFDADATAGTTCHRTSAVRCLGVRFNKHSLHESSDEPLVEICFSL